MKAENDMRFLNGFKTNSLVSMFDIRMMFWRSCIVIKAKFWLRIFSFSFLYKGDGIR